MAASGAHSIAVDECMDLGHVAEIAHEHGVGFIGNLNVTQSLLNNDPSPAEAVRKCREIVGNAPGYVLGCGAPLSYQVSPERVSEAVNEYKTWRSQEM